MDKKYEAMDLEPMKKPLRMVDPKKLKLDIEKCQKFL